MCQESGLFHWEDDISGFRKLVLDYKIDYAKEIHTFDNWTGETYVCCKCRKNLPKSTYFYNSGGENKYHRYCKVCEGSSTYGWGRKKQEELNNNGYHYCTKCDRILPLNLIYFNRTSGRCNKTGYASNCRECINTSINNFELHSINDYKDFYCIKNEYKVCQTCLIEYPFNSCYFFNKYYRSNGDVMCKQCKGFRYGYYHMNVSLANLLPEGYKFCNKCKSIIKEEEYYRNKRCCDKCTHNYRVIYNQKINTKQRLRIHAEKRRYKLKSVKQDLTINEWLETLKHFNYSCAYCGITEKEHKNITGEQLHQEHIKPLSLGGEYTKNNIIPSCRSCNSSKRTKTLDEFYFYKDTFTYEMYLKIINFQNVFNH